MRVSCGLRSGRPQSRVRWLLSSQLGWQHRQSMVWNQLPKKASLRELVIMSPYPTTLPRVGCVWQHSIEIVGCAGLIKYVGLAAENRGVLVLRYSKGTKDTSTTASPIVTETLRFTFSSANKKYYRKSVVHSRTKIRLFHCDTWMGWVPQGKRQNETSSQLVRGGSLCIRKSQGWKEYFT